MNRKQRREAKKQEKPVKKPAWHNLTKEEVAARLMQNGITPADLKKEWDRGYDAGYLDGSKPVMEAAFASVCLALHDLYGFGEKRCYNTLTRMNHFLREYLTSTEAAEQVFKEIGLTLDLDDPFEPIQEA